MISTNTILYYVCSSIYFILFSFNICAISCILFRGNSNIKRHILRISLLICIIQCLASLMTILDQSLYLLWQYSWEYWIGHTLIVSSITYTLNLLGQIMTFIVLIVLLRIMSRMIYKTIIYEGRNTRIHLIVYYTSIILCILYATISLCLLILIPYSALPSMPFVLSKDIAYMIDMIGDILTAIGWISLCLLVTTTCILNIICVGKLLTSMIKLKIVDIQGLIKRVSPLLIIIQLIAIIQIGSTIVGAIASFESFLYLISYILDKTNSLIFVMLCVMISSPIGLLAHSFENISKPQDTEQIVS